MELNKVSYFINLAETLNFKAAARLSGVSQPNLPRAIRLYEDELGGSLIYLYEKNSRLTGLGLNGEAKFQRMLVATKSVRNDSENSAMGSGRRVLGRRRTCRRTKWIYGVFRVRVSGAAIRHHQTPLAPG